MIKKEIIKTILLFAAIYAGSSAQTIVNKFDYKAATTEGLPGQKPSFETSTKAFFQRVAAWYVTAKKETDAFMREYDFVNDMVSSTYGYLKSAEQIVNNCKMVWKNINNFELNPTKFSSYIDAVEYSEKNIFEKTDALAGKDIPALERKQARLQASYDSVVNGTITMVDVYLPDKNKIRQNYGAIVSKTGVASSDTVDTRAKIATMKISTSAKALAEQEEMQKYYDAQNAMIQTSLKTVTTASGSDSTSHSVDPVITSEMARTNNRADLIMAAQEGKITSQEARMESVDLLEQAIDYDQREQERVNHEKESNAIVEGFNSIDF